MLLISRKNYPCLFLIIIVTVFTVGCGDREKPAPRVEVTTPSGPRSGDVVISYVLYDSESLPADITVQYSVNGGITFLNASQGSGGDGTTDLATNERGMGHSFVWDSIADAGYTNENNARISITAVTRKSSVPSITSNFTIENFQFGEWEPNIRVDDETGIAQATSPAIAAEGDNVYAAWEDYREGNADIYFANSANAGTTWETAIKVNNDTGSANQVDPEAVSDGSGNIYVVWTDYRDSNQAIFLSTVTNPGTGFVSTFQTQVSSASAISPSDPVIAVEGAQIYVAWTDRRNGNYDIVFRRSSDSGTNWDDEIIVNDDASATDQFEPSIAADGSGNIYLAWTDLRNMNSDIYGTVGSDSGGTIAFSANIRIDDDPGSFPAENPSIAVYNTNVYVAYEDYRNTSWDIYVASSLDSGATFSTNLRVSDDTNSSIQNEPALAVNGSTGELYVVFRDERSDGPSIYFSSSTAPTTSFTANTKIDDCESQAIQDAPDIAFGSRIYIIFRDQRNSNDDIFFTRSPKN